MSRQVNELLIAQGGLRLPSGAGAGKLAQSDASGNISWVTVASLQGKTSGTFAKGDDTEYAFSSWKLVEQRFGFIGSAGSTGTYLLGFGATAGAAGVGGASTGLTAFYFDPADFAAGGTRTTKLRVRGTLLTNAVAPGASTVFTFGLYPVATWGGASNAQPTVATVSAATLTCPTISNPAANTPQHTEAVAVTAPAAGWFVLGCALTGSSAAANSIEDLTAELHVQQV